jgi:hypothetical protein
MPKDLAILALDGNRDYFEFNFIKFKTEIFVLHFDTIGILQRILM